MLVVVDGRFVWFNFNITILYSYFAYVTKYVLQMSPFPKSGKCSSNPSSDLRWTFQIKSGAAVVPLEEALEPRRDFLPRLSLRV